MTNYREILRLKALGLSERDIARSAACLRNTVSQVLKRSEQLNLSWPLDNSQTNAELEELLYPSMHRHESEKAMPDLEWVHKELFRNGVTKKLLWQEYIETCREAGRESLMYSQFCYYIQQDEQKRRASMHIPRRPGEQVEVD
jgi:putative hemolysin